MILMNINIEKLLALLPKGYEHACYETKAIERKRTIQTPEELLVLCLYYLYGMSFIKASQFAHINEMGTLSDVALMKRFTKSNAWFQWMTKNIKPEAVIQYQKPNVLEDYHVVAIDASDIATKGAVKQTFHLHYAIELFSLTCSQFKLTEQSTGETLKNFAIKKHDLLLADRAYATKTGIESCMEQGADFIFRIKNKPFNLYKEKGEKILLTDWLKTVQEDVSETVVYIQNSKKNLQPLRICALLKTEEERKKEEKRLNKKEKKKQITISDDTKFSHRYVFVVTSLSERISAKDILELYRLRWQVEMVFKRYKSILELGSIPTKTKEATEAWLNGKMLLALLIEKFLSSVDFSLSGKERKKQEYLERNQRDVSIHFSSYHAKR